VRGAVRSRRRLSAETVTDRTNPGGGLTGATGDLTPDDPRDALVTGERREIEDPEARAHVTWEQGRNAPSQRGEVGEPGEDRLEGGLTNRAERESGYASEHGLSPDDPAYRVEIHPPASADAGSSPDAGGETRLGGDAEIDAQDDRF
jgi:hypothetical protein